MTGIHWNLLKYQVFRFGLEFPLLFIIFHPKTLISLLFHSKNEKVDLVPEFPSLRTRKIHENAEFYKIAKILRFPNEKTHLAPGSSTFPEIPRIPRLFFKTGDPSFGPCFPLRNAPCFRARSGSERKN